MPSFFFFFLFFFILFILFFSTSSTPYCWQGLGFESEAKTFGNCNHVKKALNNVAFLKMWRQLLYEGLSFQRGGEHAGSLRLQGPSRLPGARRQGARGHQLNCSIF